MLSDEGSLRRLRVQPSGIDLESAVMRKHSASDVVPSRSVIGDP
jgi:hypothetical protein